MQGVNLVLPFLTLPYLGRVLGAEKYGVVLMVYAVMQYLFVLCDYGFNLSATKDVSIFREDKEKIDRIFSNIYYIKLVLVLLAVAVLAISVYSIEDLKTHKVAYFLGFGIVIGQVLNPVWFFQGMENMKYMTRVNVIAKGLFTALIFIVIKSESDYFKVPLLYSIGFIVGGLFSMYYAFRYFEVKFTRPDVQEIKRLLGNSTQYFLSRSAAALYTSSNTFIAGLALGNYFAGIFGAAEKIFMAMTVVYAPLGDALYPYMAKKRNLKLFKKILVTVISLNTIVAIGVFFLSNWIVLLIFGPDFSDSANLLRIFCVLALLFVPAVMIGYPFLGALGKEKYANYSVVFASVLHVVLLGVLYKYLTVNRIVYLLLFTQTIVLVIRLFGAKKLILELNGENEGS
ncbi:polysaccharide transporter, PST family [Pricia antarctica]|uniref:Polysaccharide transporter, PST family n=1 Tax=Pricia antarctica TaxID=641691 RepID=A0A1G6X1D5_9FLAO|nr:polysaccharide transporter, PST family [Pricia antarctica]